MAARAPRYRLRLADPAAHRIELALTLERPDPRGQEFWLPVWIPGSYLVREFARLLLRVEASCDGRPLDCVKTDKNRWRVAPCQGPLELRWSVHAHDASVRGAYYDAERAFLNPCALLLAPAGHEHAPLELALQRPPLHPGWSVATTLPALRVDAAGWGVYQAEDYQQLIDHPLQVSELLRLPFKVGSTPHAIVFDQASRLHGELDAKRLQQDLAAVCREAVALFEPGSKRPPFARYQFLVTPTHAGYGGLEHADSTALICAASDLPHPREGERSSGYRQFLGLCSHEYFHAWNVKRIRPAALTPYALERENPTRLLWLFEGFTAYYDDLLLRRAGLLEPQHYLELLAKTIGAVRATPGRHVQSLSEASFDAWTKFYRPDANTPNATVSYYQLGSLLALALDLKLRAGGRASLDDLMRLLWRRYGRDDAPGRATGVPEDALPGLLREVSGQDFRRFFAAHVDGCDALPLQSLLRRFGVAWSHEPAKAADALGLRLDEAQGWLRVRQVRDASWAQAAGLASDDLLLALHGRRLDLSELERSVARARPGDDWSVHLMRDGRLLQLAAPLPKFEPGPVRLQALARPSAAALRLRRDWLGA